MTRTMRGAALIAVLGSAIGTAFANEPEDAYLDSILQRRVLTPSEQAQLDLDGQPGLDVRDLVLFLDGLPVAATFETEETIVYHQQAIAMIPILFSKPVSGTVSFGVSGDAQPGSDYTLSATDLPLTNATKADIVVSLPPQWRGDGGERVLQLILNRSQTLLPRTGRHQSHTIRMRKYDAGEYVGMLMFPTSIFLPSSAIRVGLMSSGDIDLLLVGGDSFIGRKLMFRGHLATDAFPEFDDQSTFSIPGAHLMRSRDAEGAMRITRKTVPDEDFESFLTAFPSEDKPAVYGVEVTLADLIGAGVAHAAGTNPFAVRMQGHLTLQPVRYAASLDE